MNGNNDDEYDEEWVDDSEPVYRSLSLGQATFGAQQFGECNFGSEGMMSDSMMQTYDADEEAPVYRSLAVAPPANPHATFGGFSDMGMSAHTMAQPKAAPVMSQTTNCKCHVFRTFSFCGMTVIDTSRSFCDAISSANQYQFLRSMPCVRQGRQKRDCLQGI